MKNGTNFVCPMISRTSRNSLFNIECIKNLQLITKELLMV